MLVHFSGLFGACQLAGQGHVAGKVSFTGVSLCVSQEIPLIHEVVLVVTFDFMSSREDRTPLARIVKQTLEMMAVLCVMIDTRCI